MLVKAASGGSIEIVQWLRSHDGLKGGEVDRRFMHIAALYNHLALVQYMQSLGTAWDDYMFEGIASRGHLDMLQWLADQKVPMPHHEIAWQAAKHNRLNILQSLDADQGVALEDTQALDGAARGGHIPLMEWLMNRGCTVDPAVCTAAVMQAAEADAIAVLEWLRVRGQLILAAELYNWTLACSYGPKNDKCSLVKWLREVANCPWDAPSLAMCAAYNGHLETLQYIHKHGGPFTAEQLTQQLHDGRKEPEVRRWLREQGAKRARYSKA